MRNQAIVLLLLLSACSREPDFDQRYTEAQRKLAAKSAAMDRDLSHEQGTTAVAKGAARKDAKPAN